MALALVLTLAVGACAGAPLVEIPKLGTVEGILAPDMPPGIELFKGIPYGKPPIGELRWQPPQQHPGWEVPFKANTFGAPCWQAAGATGPAPPNMNEDCLNLNIARPAGATAGSSLPVMLWWHGGGNSAGSTDERYLTEDGWSYNLGSLVAAANHSVIVVSAAYRLNAFGFLGSAELMSTSADGSAGNFGLQDQRLAMRWIKENIGAFGGSTDVTLFGESAGACDIAYHLTQPASYGLYSKAIIQSYGNSEREVISLKSAQVTFEQLMTNVNCTNVTCLRLNTTAEQIVSAIPVNTQWNPVVDGVNTKATPAELFAKKHFNDVPVIIGSNHAEMSVVTHGSSTIPGLPWNMSEFQLDSLLHGTSADGTLPQFQLSPLPTPGPKLTEPEIKHIKELYSPVNYSDYPPKLGQYSTFWWMATMIKTDTESTGFCQTRRFARQLANSSRLSRVFAYMFTHPAQYYSTEPLYTGFGPGNVIVPHGSDVRFVFNSIPPSALDSDKDVALRLASAWASFAVTTDPSSSGHIPGWHEYTREQDAVMYIQSSSSGTRMRKHVRTAACDFWDARWEKYGPGTDQFCQWQCKPKPPL